MCMYSVTRIHLHHFIVVYLCLFKFGLEVYQFLFHLSNLQRDIVRISCNCKKKHKTSLVKMSLHLPEIRRRLVYPDHWCTSVLTS